jgi:hypothetical protein
MREVRVGSDNGARDGRSFGSRTVRPYRFDFLEYFKVQEWQ